MINKNFSTLLKKTFLSIRNKTTQANNKMKFTFKVIKTIRDREIIKIQFTEKGTAI